MMTGTRAPRSTVIVLGLILAASAAAAETVYVSDRFEIGVHESTELDSVIVAVVPSGTPLTVVKRNDNYVEVTTADGVRGWVDARYVVSEKPSVALLEERDARLVEAVRNLGDARAEVEVLRQRVRELQRDATTAAQDAPAASQPVALESSAVAAKLETVERALETATRENRLLKVQVADLQATKSELERAVEESASDSEGSSSMWRGPVADEGRSWTPWQWLLFGSILLLAFAAGGYAVDWESRRRHGGFRI